MFLRSFLQKPYSFGLALLFIGMVSCMSPKLFLSQDDFNSITEQKPLGKHLIIDLYGCNIEKIKEVPAVEKIITAAALAANAKIIKGEFHQFMPMGVTGVLLLAESHLAIHTWPEKDGYCAIDIFTCGVMNNFAALDVLQKAFEAKHCYVVQIDRGSKHAEIFQTGSCKPHSKL